MSVSSQPVHAPTGVPMKERSMSVINAALSIADDAVRSDVECCALIVKHPEGFDCYDLTRAQNSSAMSEADKQQAVAVAVRAASYIELRGDVFPWRMLRVDGSKRLVRFVNKEQTS